VSYIPQIARYAPYAGDETETSTTSTTYATLKQFNFSYLSSVGITPSTMIIVAECYIDTGGETATLGIYVDGNLQTTIDFTENSYTVKTASVDLSSLGLSDGKHLVEIKMQVTGGTGYLRMLEAWMR